ncbi:MAG TPA: hypothetical protein VMX74_14505 [Pirellulales bacterium]|nr:hypothetical protein [Pirellulales bacterium]
MTTKNIHIYIVNLSVPDENPPFGDRRSAARQPVARNFVKHDPYIAGLIERLQREVREERELPWTNRLTNTQRWPDVRNEAPPPLSEWPTERGLPDRSEHWPLIDFDSEDLDF